MTSLLTSPFVWFLAAIAAGGIVVTRWVERRLLEPVYTYGQLTPNGSIDLTRGDYEALMAQTDAEIDQAIALTKPAPDYGPILDIIAANEAARNLTDDRLRDWVEGKR
ncbi:MAG: hypothetical protein CMJ18_07585 [Phycisphaeraceae bacterium]|nr:hypothetical protein [Phycisphaeraceae bacterium]